MANTYSQIYIHVVFTVKGRANLIRKDFKDELHKYIAGIIRNEEQKLLAIGGVSDHIHIFIGLKPDQKISDLVRIIKANSSKFINEKKYVKGKFNWQEGYGAFSYAQSQKDTVIKYIMNQEKHHIKKSFKEEYTELLKRFEIESSEKYLFEWLD
jgi:REP element-mobilizing transposase RayT